MQVVVTNQLTTKVDDGQFAYQAAPAYAWGGGGSGPPLAPTLGAFVWALGGRLAW